MKLKEWIKLYDKKVAEKFERDERYALFYVSDKGFCEIGSNGQMIIANQMAGDIKFWRKALEEVCRASGLKTIGTYCERNIEAYMRLAGFTVYKKEEAKEGTRYYCTDYKTGQNGQCSPAWELPNGKRAYYVTWRVS